MRHAAGAPEAAPLHGSAGRLRYLLPLLPSFVGLLIAAIVTGVTIRYATFVPWGTDSANYLTAARGWAAADLFRPAPLDFSPLPWPDIGLPLAERHTRIRGASTSMYPLGFPLFLAAGYLLHSEFGPYLVPPVLAGLLVWSTFLIANRLAGGWAGVIAAVLMALCPIALAHTVVTMSDVPAAGFFMLAIAMSIRGTATSAAAAGAAFAAAVMTRPVLAPLGIVPAALVLSGDTARLWPLRPLQWKKALLFCGLAALGPAMILWSQKMLYGGFLTPGYVAFGTFFSRERIVGNLLMYPRNISAVHTPLVALGLAGAVPLSRRLRHDDPRAAQIIVALVAAALMNYASYLPYLSFDTIWYTRFLLPAMAVMFVLLAAVTVHAARALSRRSKVLAAACFVPAVIVPAAGRELFPFIFNTARSQENIRQMGRYLDEVLPLNAAVVTFLQGGAVAYYTGAQIVRYDLIQPQMLEATLDTLVRRGYHPVFLIDQEMEGLGYKMQFAGTKYERLDWKPRAKFVAATTLWYLDYADRDGSLERKGVPTDILH
ncbi:MAG TPA: glycosyltransferase family 39 protein [Vicinamibacterales bacterium]|nr:glycosyltransferase family 39 protein [Vicinamibacterales bacterium]